jgi:hypothetical protein
MGFESSIIYKIQKHCDEKIGCIDDGSIICINWS